MTDAVHVEHRGPITLLTIDRPEAFNALDDAVLSGIESTLQEAEASASTRVLVITGSGDKAFCAGADLRELQTMNLQAADAQIGRGQSLFRRIELTDVPVVTAVNGLALGGGFELVLASTVPIVSTRASFGLPETLLGLIPGYGGTQRLPRVVGPHVAAHLMLTGARLNAERAHALGLTPVAPVEPGDLLESALELAGTIARQGPEAVRSVLAALGEGRDVGFEAGLAAEHRLAAAAIAGDESSEGIAAFLERRAPEFEDRRVEGTAR
ncbi:MULTISPECIES: enoyl-CoA hydratase/isomerase family protein [unclassified Aeromicrobium]|uniref:enoyl-CoA hydratase/isomerase family protein n=1 Tax=unclassified Aeromicrobium TaxID=2633570 RepID=UPI00396B1CD1